MKMEAPVVGAFLSLASACMPVQTVSSAMLMHGSYKSYVTYKQNTNNDKSGLYKKSMYVLYLTSLDQHFSTMDRDMIC